ncbi:hypothetical protein [Natrialba sp. INN-245]|uniref:hypothetical protein n=1 Tax=Natrialba sp. INN-245 TaxID=2690967 RepID=UPI0013128AEB|nr:hypothetical protein [Natrialba sp. INN-245]MWV38762.1 hypothetical protein [Natrialba sp. INN-245]
MDSSGWVASDSTKYKFHDQRPNWISLASVAIAVDDICEFNSSYEAIIEDKKSEYGIRTQHPIIKDEDITRWVPDWERAEARRDIVTELLSIEYIRDIQFVETSLDPMWVTVFEDNEDDKRRMNSQEFMNSILEKYYNIIAIWEYLRREHVRPEDWPSHDWPVHKNILTDDFGGNVSPAWLEIGSMADDIKVVPQGDRTYPLLSLADLTMDMVKQHVPEWHEKQIYEFLKRITPENSAYVDSVALDSNPPLSKVIPHTKDSVRTLIHYPTPTTYIYSGSVGNKKAKSLDIYEHACRFAMENNGCVKFFNESHDRDFMSDEDLLISLNEHAGNLREYEDLNDDKSVTVLNREEAKELFHDEIGGFEHE